MKCFLLITGLFHCVLQNSVRDVMEFSLNVFTEFAEFSDKKKSNKIKNEQCGAGTQDLLCKRQRWYHKTTETEVTEQILINSCFSDSSDSLNSLNSLNWIKVMLHLEKTPLIDYVPFSSTHWNISKWSKCFLTTKYIFDTWYTCNCRVNGS